MIRKKIWGVISEILNRKVKHSVPETMTINSQDCSNKEIIVEECNTFFATIGEKINKIFANMKGRTVEIILLIISDAILLFI